MANGMILERFKSKNCIYTFRQIISLTLEITCYFAFMSMRLLSKTILGASGCVTALFIYHDPFLEPLQELIVVARLIHH